MKNRRAGGSRVAGSSGARWLYGRRFTDAKADFGVMGLAVMGANLALNIESRGFICAVFNRTTEKTVDFIDRNRGRRLVAGQTVREFVNTLKRPRKIILMVKAGAGVDETMAHLLPHLSPGDVLIDGGNSYFRDTDRRVAAMAAQGIRYLGCGISGGEEGALKGPSIMPGGDPAAWKLAAPVLRAIAAKTEDGPCVTYLGARSAGHFVKMVHNGIEYSMMQMLAEFYDLMKTGLGMTPEEAQEAFAKWNAGRCGSYLVEITALVLNHRDPGTGKPLVELILDKAEQKGTGKWTSQAALDLGVPVPSITAAVEARIISGHKRDRVAIARVFPAKSRRLRGVNAKTLEGACYAGFLAAYAQGLHMLGRASAEYGYGINLAEVARIWKGGCIVRSRILDVLRRAYRAEPRLAHPFLAPVYRRALAPVAGNLRAVVSAATAASIPVPSLGATVAYLDGMGRSRLPANLIQAQRDHFGAHTYERIDRPGVFHTKWD